MTELVSDSKKPRFLLQRRYIRPSSHLFRGRYSSGLLSSVTICSPFKEVFNIPGVDTESVKSAAPVPSNPLVVLILG